MLRLMVIGMVLGALVGCGLVDGDSRGTKNPYPQTSGTWATRGDSVVAIIDYPNWEVKILESGGWAVFSGTTEKDRLDTSSYLVGKEVVQKTEIRFDISISKQEKRLSDGTSLALENPSKYRITQAPATMAFSFTNDIKTPDKISTNLCIPGKCGLVQR